MTTLQHLPTSEIRPHPRNIRRDLGDLDELTDSVRAKGLLQPLVVVPAGSDARGYLLLMGHRRLAAAEAAGLDTVPCVVRDDLDTPAAQIETMLVENLQRTDLSPVEEGDAYQALLEYPGYTVPKIAKATGRSKRTITQRITIAGLTDGVREKVHTGQITLDDAAALAEFADDSQALARLEQAAGTSEFRWVLEQSRRAREKARLAAETRASLEAAGVPIVDNVPRYTLWDPDAPVRMVGGPAASAIRMHPEEHAAFPCHAALPPVTDVIEYVCTNPSAHVPDDDTSDDSASAGGDTRVAESPEAAAEREARLRELEQLRDDLHVAAALRRQFIRDVLTRPLTPAHAAAVTRAVCELAARGWIETEPADWLEWLDVDVDVEDEDPDEAEATLRAALTDRDPHHAALAMVASVLDHGLSSTSTWLWHERDYTVWIGLLAALGYEWSPFESGILAAESDEADASGEVA